ncbi:uncharacterized protein LOC144770932 [Lissotriton helveticus]
MSWQQSEEPQASFHDASAYFSEDEWRLLHDWQKELCKNVMREIHQALVSLGPLIATTVFSLRTKENQNLYPVDNDECGQALGFHDSSSGFITSPDVVYKVEQEENLLPKNPKSAWGRPGTVCLTKEEPASSYVDQFGADVEERSIDQDYAVCLTKEEPASICIDQFGAEAEERSIDQDYGNKSIRRQRQVAEFIHRPKLKVPKRYFSRNTNVEVLQDSPEQVNSRSMLQSEDYWEQMEEETSKIGFNNSKLKVGLSQTNNECQSNLNNSPFLKGLPNMQKAQRIYRCSEPDESFSHKEKLTQLKGERSKVGRYACSACPKTYFYKANLLVHFRSHSGEKPCSCTCCGKRFSRQDNLKRHMKRHTGERPYICGVCGKHYTWKESFKQHQQTHIEGDPSSSQTL